MIITKIIKIAYCLEKVKFLLKQYIELKSFVLVQRVYRSEYHENDAPIPRTIKRISDNFENTGLLPCLARIHAKPTEKRENAKKRVEILFNENTSLSIRKSGRVAEISIGLTYTLFDCGKQD